MARDPYEQYDARKEEAQKMLSQLGVEDRHELLRQMGFPQPAINRVRGVTKYEIPFCTPTDAFEHGAQMEQMRRKIELHGMDAHRKYSDTELYQFMQHMLLRLADRTLKLAEQNGRPAPKENVGHVLLQANRFMNPPVLSLPPEKGPAL